MLPECQRSTGLVPLESVRTARSYPRADRDRCRRVCERSRVRPRRPQATFRMHSIRTGAHMIRPRTSRLAPADFVADEAERRATGRVMKKSSYAAGEANFHSWIDLPPIPIPIPIPIPLIISESRTGDQLKHGQDRLRHRRDAPPDGSRSLLAKWPVPCRLVRNAAKAVICGKRIRRHLSYGLMSRQDEQTPALLP